MKVVKCLEHIPKLCWGKVIKNDMLAVSDTSEMDLLYYLNPTDTFPLPEQGDEIEVTATGKDTSWIDRFIYHGVADGIFVIKNKLGEPSCVKYIRPIEKEECNSLDFHFGNIQKSLDAIKIIKTNES